MILPSLHANELGAVAFPDHQRYVAEFRAERAPSPLRRSSDSAVQAQRRADGLAAHEERQRLTLANLGAYIRLV
jgi:hypothetical protein